MQEPPPAVPRVKARAASAESPGFHRRRRRSRSPHAAPSVFHVLDGASEGRVTAAVKFLQDAIEGMERQRVNDQKNLALLTARVSAQETSRKLAEDSARRMDAIESQVREQTNEAKEYARHKCLESDKQLRA